MAKITPVLSKHKTNAKGHAPIYLRIYAGGKTRYKSLSVTSPSALERAHAAREEVSEDLPCLAFN